MPLIRNNICPVKFTIGKYVTQYTIFELSEIMFIKTGVEKKEDVVFLRKFNSYYIIFELTQQVEIWNSIFESNKNDICISFQREHLSSFLPLVFINDRQWSFEVTCHMFVNDIILSEQRLSNHWTFHFCNSSRMDFLLQCNLWKKGFFKCFINDSLQKKIVFILRKNGLQRIIFRIRLTAHR